MTATAGPEPIHGGHARQRNGAYFLTSAWTKTLDGAPHQTTVLRCPVTKISETNRPAAAADDIRAQRRISISPIAARPGWVNRSLDAT
jgi:hypothetical protein